MGGWSVAGLSRSEKCKDEFKFVVKLLFFTFLLAFKNQNEDPKLIPEGNWSHFPHNRELWPLAPSMSAACQSNDVGRLAWIIKTLTIASSHCLIRLACCQSMKAHDHSYIYTYKTLQWNVMGETSAIHPLLQLNESAKVKLEIEEPHVML